MFRSSLVKSAAVLVMVAFGIGADVSPKAIEGTWDVLSFVTPDDKGKGNEARKYELTFTDGEFSVTKEGTVIYQGTYKVDSSKSPMFLDLSFTKGNGLESKTSLGIYDVKGDGLRILLGAAKEGLPPAVTRPTRFAAATGGRTSITAHRRQKSGKP